MSTTQRWRRANRSFRLWSPLLLAFGFFWLASHTGYQPYAPPQPATPTIEIAIVREDRFVIVEARDFPADKEFTVTLGAMGTRGVGGVEVDNFTTPSDAFAAVFFIPEALHGRDRIAIRLQSDDTRPYYAFNWFYNRNAP